jgi:enoyl-CoA hydratase
MPIAVEVYDQTLVIRMDRADKHNAINEAMAIGISEALDRLDEDGSVRVGVLTGTPEVFCAGTDLAEGVVAATERGGEYGVIRRRRSKPLIAAVDGPCLGGGLEIALTCDLIVASTTARFAFPEARLGLVPALGGLFRAARALPNNVASELLITGRALTAKRAYDIGFVNRLAEPGQALVEALMLSQDVYLNAPAALDAILEALAAQRDSAEKSGWRITSNAVHEVLAADDVREGIAAFFEKRPPVWREAAHD